MTFEEKLKLNCEAYLSAKEDNKRLNREVATRNNTRNIIVSNYDISPENNSPSSEPQTGTE
jgi:hypothetical protein